MDNKTSFLIGFIIASILCLFLGIGGCEVNMELMYRQGQIDALSGNKIQYELINNPDGTVTWEKINKENNQE